MVSTSDDDDDDDGDNDEAELEGEVSGTDDAVSQPRSRGRQRSAKSSRDGRQGSARSQGSRKRNNWVHASAQQHGTLHKNLTRRSPRVGYRVCTRSAKGSHRPRNPAAADAVEVEVAHHLAKTQRGLRVKSGMSRVHFPHPCPRTSPYKVCFPPTVHVTRSEPRCRIGGYTAPTAPTAAVHAVRAAGNRR